MTSQTYDPFERSNALSGDYANALEKCPRERRIALHVEALEGASPDLLRNILAILGAAKPLPADVEFATCGRVVSIDVIFDRSLVDCDAAILRRIRLLRAVRRADLLEIAVGENATRSNAKI